jgi:rhodanese-related sulfurtransferase
MPFQGYPLIHLRTLLLSITALFAITVSSLAAEQMSAPEVFERAQNGEVLLIDVRRPSEWKESGVASVAVPLSMHETGFLEGLAALREANVGKRIALICATGGRTAFLQEELAKRGLGTAIDVSEGMFGNGAAPGWIRRGLPLKAHE